MTWLMYINQHDSFTSTMTHSCATWLIDSRYGTHSRHSYGLVHMKESCCTSEGVISHIWRSHMDNESYHACIGVMLHLWRNHVAGRRHLLRGCTYERVRSHIWKSQVTYIKESCHAHDGVITHIKDLCQTYEGDTTHIGKSWGVAHMKESRHRYEGVMSYIRTRNRTGVMSHL